ncbi:MAG: hypothetical protein ACUVX8_05560 [Candidatus Zipacnadales bacterium]
MLTTNIPKVKVAAEHYKWLQEECRRLLRECQVEAYDGTPLYTPDTQRHYNALWTRDFCYMVEGAGRLIPLEHIAIGIDYILRRQRYDGVIPDRVQSDGTPIYCAGPLESPLGTRPPTDNPQFLVKLVSEYLFLTMGSRKRTGNGGECTLEGFRFVEPRMEALWRALETLPQTPDGAVYVEPTEPHAEYGFTDTVAKTGPVFFSTLLLWEAWQLMGGMARRLENHDLAHEAYERAERVHRTLGQFWSDEFGMFEAALRDCRQLDLWGSAYAVRIGAVGSRQRQQIAGFFCDLYDSCVLRGHVRHLVAGQFWERMLVKVPDNTYQNGGYWAVPSGWVARCLLSSPQPELAGQLIHDLLVEFREGGVCEWISETEHALPGYVVSATLLLDSVKTDG